MLKGQQQLVEGSIPRCPFFVNVYGKNNEWKITQICIAHDHYHHCGFQSKTFVESDLASDTPTLRSRDVSFAALQEMLLREMLPAYGGSLLNVTGKAIMELLRSKGMKTNRQTASKLKMALLESFHGDMVDSYQHLEGFLAAVCKVNLKSSYAFEKTAGGVFQRACFFSGSCIHAAQYCKHVVGLDGTHLKGDMNKRGVFLLAMTKDYNNHILVMSIALVDKENFDNWLWFVTRMKHALGSDFTERPVFVSDRQKGLLGAVTKAYPNCGHRYCVRHIITNVDKATSALSPNEQSLVFAMSRSECQNDYIFYRSRLFQTRPNAATYLDGIKKQHWVTYAFSEAYDQPSYDEVTSNLSEAANQWLGNECRSSYPKQAFEDYMINVVKLFAKRRDESRPKTQKLSSTAEPPNTNFILDENQLVDAYKKKLTGILALAKTYTIIPSIEGVYMVRFTDVSTRPDHAHIWRSVNLAEKNCTCRRWQDQQFSCVYAVKVAIHHGVHVTSLFDKDKLSRAQYAKTYYQQFIPVVSAQQIPVDRTLLVPDIVAEEEDIGSRGRKPGPKPKHKRKAAKPGSTASPYIATT